jgi:hypothetical protein
LWKKRAMSPFALLQKRAPLLKQCIPKEMNFSSEKMKIYAPVHVIRIRRRHFVSKGHFVAKPVPPLGRNLQPKAASQRTGSHHHN